MHTFKAVVRTTSPRKAVATMAWDGLNPLTGLHQYRARDIWADTLVRHTAVTVTQFHKDRVLWAGVRLCRAVTRDRNTRHNGSHVHRLMADIGRVSCKRMKGEENCLLVNPH